MKVLIATGLYPPEIGGPATYTALLERELPQRRHQVVVVPFRLSRRLPKGIRHFHYCYMLLKHSKGVGVIFAQDVVSVGLPALVMARLLGKKFFVRVPGDYAWEQSVQRFGVIDTIDEFQTKSYGKKVQLLRKVQTIVTKYADQVITPSEYFRTLIIGWGVDAKKVTTIYNGVDLNIKVAPGLVKPASLVLLSAGRLVPWKGFECLIEAMQALPNWQLVILGEGPEREKLQGQIEKLGLQNQIELKGNVSREEVFAWCTISDAFVLNTHFESFSFQIVEAMAAGIPIITTTVGSLPELITHEKEGILVTPNDSEAFLAAIKTVVTDKASWQRRVNAAHEKAEMFSIQRTVDKLCLLLE